MKEKETVEEVQRRAYHFHLAHGFMKWWAIITLAFAVIFWEVADLVAAAIISVFYVGFVWQEQRLVLRARAMMEEEVSV